MLVSLQRQQQALLATRALVQSTLPEGKAADPAIKAFQVYYDAQMPFMERAANADKEAEREALLDFVKHPVRIPLAPIYQAQAESAKRLTRLRRFLLKPKVPE